MTLKFERADDSEWHTYEGEFYVYLPIEAPMASIVDIGGLHVIGRFRPVFP